MANHPDGLEAVTLDGRVDSLGWAKKVSALAKILAAEKPTVTFLPHEQGLARIPEQACISSGCESAKYACRVA